MNLHIRPCSKADLEILRDISVRTYFETFAKENTAENMQAYLEAAFSPEKLSAELDNPDSRFYFLYVDNQLAAYLKLNESDAQSDIRDKTSLEIERIYVDAPFQGLGLGRYLIERAIEIAREKGKQYVWLGVWEKNLKAIRFYERNGFYRFSSHSFFMGEEEQHDYILRKDLEKHL